MDALHEIVEDAPAQLVVDLPPAFRHRRVEVTVTALDDEVTEATPRRKPNYKIFTVEDPGSASEEASRRPHYNKFKVDRILIPPREELYDR